MYIRDFVKSKEGKVWTAEDTAEHDRMLDAIEKLAEDLYQKAKTETARDVGRKSIFSSGGGAKLPERNTR